MPPRYAYWTILVDDQPTAFRAGSQDDLMPTFKRLKEKHPSAVMMWFQNGKLWPSRIDAQEAMRARGELGRRGDERQQGGFRDRDRRPSRAEKPEWKPKGEFTPAPKRSERPDWKPRTSRPRDLKTTEKLDWKPKGDFKPEWKPKGSSPKGSFDRERKPAWTPKPAGPQARRTSASGKLEWKPKGEGASRPEARSPEKRKWIPKEEYKKSLGIEAKRDGKWRPGGEHRDPRQKYKDAKKAKWGRFKQTIRQTWKKKQDKKGDK